MSTNIDLRPAVWAGKRLLTPSTDSESSVVSAWVSQPWIHALQRLVVQLENEPWLAEPNKLRERLEALDRLDAYYPFAPQVAGASESFGQMLPVRAKAIRDRLEAVNTDLYEAIRCQIQRGSRAHGLLQWIPPSLAIEDLDESANGMGYDCVDELISGVFQFEEPDDGDIPRDSEKSCYQPTPARHIFSLIGLTALTADDVFVDLGSGLGHVSILVSICTYARSFGIELEASYVECAQQCARRLNLDQVTFIQEDARAADLSVGTVFYLYTPFMGFILRTVLKRLQREAATRRIRICSYGPCTSVVAEESWLVATTAPEAHLITVFCCRT